MKSSIPLSVKTEKPINSLLFDALPGSLEISSLLLDADPSKAIASGKVMAKSFFKSLKDTDEHLEYSHSFIYLVVCTYWEDLVCDAFTRELPVLSNEIKLISLDTSVVSLGVALGHAVAKLECSEASYQLGNLYTSLLPESFRSGNGIFYTPPSLANRLLDMVKQTGVDWGRAKVIDPACGGGAFLIPVLLRMLKALKGKEPLAILDHVERHLTGHDIDAFGAWLSQVFLEVTLKDVMHYAGRRVGSLVKVTDSLEVHTGEKYDVVIGNPPYGKIRLTPEVRERYNHSLFGHANLYGVFFHAAIDMVKDGGTIGYLTPTSFLSGEYFKNLRSYLRQNTSPSEMDFVLYRKGVFEDVLQETLLSTYVKNNVSKHSVCVNGVNPTSLTEAEILPIGVFDLPELPGSPWILARQPSQSKLVAAMSKMKFSLKDWGFKVSTGPLVWNRHKDQLMTNSGDLSFPIIWAESITPDGRFIWKAVKKNHAPFFHRKDGDQWLVTDKPCILLQRTTAKEQHKRLIAATLPIEFIRQYGGVVVENHLNMILPIANSTAVAITTLSAFLNSKVVNDAFRTVSGSVAVSAYELESLPLPDPYKLKGLTSLLNGNFCQQDIEVECLKIYS